MQLCFITVDAVVFCKQNGSDHAECYVRNSGNAISLRFMVPTLRPKVTRRSTGCNNCVYNIRGTWYSDCAMFRECYTQCNYNLYFSLWPEHCNAPRQTVVSRYEAMPFCRRISHGAGAFRRKFIGKTTKMETSRVGVGRIGHLGCRRYGVVRFFNVTGRTDAEFALLRYSRTGVVAALAFRYSRFAASRTCPLLIQSIVRFRF